MVGRLELNDAVGMASIFSTRNSTDWTTSNHNVGVKSSFSNANDIRNPKRNRNPNSFSRKQLNHKIDNVDVNELISGDNTSFNRINRGISTGNGGCDDDVRVLYSHYVRYDISGFLRGELRNLRLKLVSELDKVRSLSCKIASSTKKRSRPSQLPAQTVLPAQTAQVESYVASPVVMNMCKTVLRKLSTQKAGIWFNSPVDVVSMGLHDYHTVINRPMDLGTIKGNLERRVYNTPVEFADDVRLTFNNAIRYNPKGHEVNTFATHYLALFERLFVPVFAKFNSEKLYHFHHLGPKKPISPLPVPIPVSKGDLPVVLDGSFTKLPSPEPPKPVKKPVKKTEKKTEKKAEKRAKIEERREAVAVVERVERRGRPPGEKFPKPRAKDTNKREMSVEEKHKLGDGLQNLPEDKMVQVINIIRRRNGELSQDGDEVELDMEALDVETLWELDRLLTNHKKSASKITRLEVYPPANYNVGLIDDSSQAGTSEMMVEMTMVKNVDFVEEDVDIGGDEMPANNFPPLQIDKDDSSSSDGSSSSSSDSDSGTSSGSDSDVDDAQSCDKQSKNFRL